MNEISPEHGMEHFLSSMSVMHPSGNEPKENIWRAKALSENNLEDDRIGPACHIKSELSHLWLPV